ncbi:autotransporter outer membrane beta-barrel domain-containing protein [Rhodanobacter sp. C01]|uniref:autotransporter family protein n=1 Tax=Rhodanobacter sp. C01 TaxID=1945856 RepID=UPI001C2C9CA2|nr:autotransporter outer membrane beta-barrel domain-containing protein [Rhodanobacter sp. C01]
MIAQTGSSNVTINISQGVNFADTRALSPVAFSVDHASQITNSGAITLTGGGGTGTNRGAALLGVGDNNSLTNASQGSITTTGAYNDGMAANGSFNTLTNNGTISTAGPNAYGMTAAWGQTILGQANNTLINNGSVSTSGSNARAMSILGQNGTITNTGSLLTTGANSPTAYMQGNNDSLVNSGTIQAQGSGSDAVFSNTVGSSFTASIQNLAGGKIISQQGAAIRTLNGASTIINAGLLQSTGVAVQMGNGVNTLILQTGSVIIGSADGGSGSAPSTVILQGSGSATNAFTHFKTLLAQGTDWDWSGTGAFNTALVQGGTFNLSGTVSGAGSASDTLTFDDATVTGIAGFTNWESVAVTNGTRLTMDGTLVMGDATSGTGNVTIDADSMLLAGNGANGVIQPFTAGQLVNVTNAGTIDLTNGGMPAANTFTIVGNYTGNQASLLLNTVLGADNSPADRLVISGGTASGSTDIHVTNVGGVGGFTANDGILLVEAANGATIAPTAFALSGGQVQAGAYTYYLFEGGVSDGTSQNWYLRSSAPPAPPPPSAPAPAPAPSPAPPPAPPPSTPIAALGTPALPTPVPAGDPPTPLFRPETALDSNIPALTKQMGLTQLGTFDERQGGQLLVTGDGLVPAAWVRVIGLHNDQAQQGATASRFDGDLNGVQAGHDLYAREGDDGDRDHIGAFIGYTHASGQVDGNVAGFPDTRTGDLSVDANSIGAYWTHIGPANGYVDAVLMETWLRTSIDSIQGFHNSTDGKLFTASLEGGKPLQLGQRLTLEPQMQVIWQHINTDTFQDPVSSVAFTPTNAITGRIGLRLQSNIVHGEQVWQPYLKANFWRDFNRTYNTVFAGMDNIPTNLASTAFEFGGGISAHLTRHVSLFGEVSYLTNLDAVHRRGVEGNLGLRIVWGGADAPR